MSTEKIVRQFQQVGAACVAVRLQNTHSGNMSLRENRPDGSSEMYITSHGAMLGRITEMDLRLPGMDYARRDIKDASTELNIHRGILAFDKAVIHAHPLHATVFTYGNDKIRPIDITGACVLGDIPVLKFEPAVFNPIMERDIPEAMKHKKVVMVARHGCFARGVSLEQALHHVSILENSAQIIYEAALLGVDTQAAAEQINGRAADGWIEEEKTDIGVVDENILNDLRRTARDIFYLGLSPFGAGSASARDDDTIFFASGFSRPKGFDVSVKRLPLEPVESDPPEALIHKHIYKAGSGGAVIHTHNPEAIAQGWLAAKNGSEHITPIDVEGNYHYHTIPILAPDSGIEELAARVNEKKMAVLHMEGVWSVGKTLNDALHNNSSIRNICFYRTALDALARFGEAPPAEKFE